MHVSMNYGGMSCDELFVAATERVTISPKRQGFAGFIRELWRFRELLYFLAWRDLKVRYKQTALGAAWAILQPLAIALSVSLFLGRVANLPSDGVPYTVFVYAAMLVWQLFSQVLADASNSLVANDRLITKVYFPRILVPISTMVSGLVDFAFGFALLVLLHARFHLVPSAAALTFPLFVLLAATAAVGAGLWLAALNVEYRDVRYTLAFIVQAWFFLSPVAYSAALVPPRWRLWYGLNPMAGAVEGFRWALLPVSYGAPIGMVLVSAASALVLLMTGIAYFRRMEDTFADVL